MLAARRKKSWAGQGRSEAERTLALTASYAETTAASHRGSQECFADDLFSGGLRGAERCGDSAQPRLRSSTLLRREGVPLGGRLLGSFRFSWSLGTVAIQFANDGRMNFRDRDVNGNSFLAGLDFEQGGKLPFRLRANSVRSANIEESQRVSNITSL